jgi:hypothetical protein
MKDQLERATNLGRVVYILAHIPPTVGSYRHSQFWHEQYVDKYFDVVDRYKDIIQGHLFGHLHTEEFRLLRPKGYTNLSIPLLIASSVSPVYGSNPSYRIVSYDKDDGGLIDFETFFLDLEKTYTTAVPHWSTLPSFTDAYEVAQNLSSDSLETILTIMSQPIDDEGSMPIWTTFLERQSVYSSKSQSESEGIACDLACRVDWLCTLGAISQRDYNDCIIVQRGGGTYHGVLSRRPYYVLGIAATLLVVLLLLASVLVVVFKSFFKRRQFTQIESDVGDIEVDERRDDITDLDVVAGVSRREII